MPFSLVDVPDPASLVMHALRPDITQAYRALRPDITQVYRALGPERAILGVIAEGKTVFIPLLVESSRAGTGCI